MAWQPKCRHRRCTTRHALAVRLARHETAAKKRSHAFTTAGQASAMPRDPRMIAIDARAMGPSSRSHSVRLPSPARGAASPPSDLWPCGPARYDGHSTFEHNAVEPSREDHRLHGGNAGAAGVPHADRRNARVVTVAGRRADAIGTDLSKPGAPKVINNTPSRRPQSIRVQRGLELDDASRASAASNGG